MTQAPPRIRRALAAATTVGYLLAFGVAAGDRAAEVDLVQSVRHAEDLYIIDCLLPGALKKIGRYQMVQLPRRVVRATGAECVIRGGEYSLDRSNFGFALQYWIEQAESGDAAAANWVGEIYERGPRGEPDMVSAAEWYRKAADQGDRRAARNLAALFEQGLGVKKDAVEALRWSRKAAGLTGEFELDMAREAGALREELARVRRESDALNADLESTRIRLVEARRELEAATTSPLQRPAPGNKIASGAGSERAERARLDVKSLEAALDRFGQERAQLEAAEKAGTRLELKGAEAVAFASGPEIAFVRPELHTTRGPLVASLASGAGEIEIVGQVMTEAGLASLTIDGAPQVVDNEGFFRVTLAVKANQQLLFQATDLGRKSATAIIVFSPKAEPGTMSAEPAAGAREWTEALAKPADRYRALVVANSNYRSFPRLESAQADGEAIADVLTRFYGFNVKLIVDATELQLLQQLARMQSEMREGDGLLLYYAGHGRIDPASGKGSWILTDADPGGSTGYLAVDEVASYLATFKARSVLIVSDSCYSGTFASGGAERRVPAGPATTARARLVLTSGGLSPVLDRGSGMHSIFARALLDALTFNAAPISALQLHRSVRARVMLRAQEMGFHQEPLLAPIRFAGHEGGGFVLLPRPGGVSGS